MAGLGRKVWANEILAQSDLQGYLQDQVNMRFATATARGAAITAPTEGMVTYLDDVDRFEYHNGTVWQELAGGLTAPVEIAYATGFSAYNDAVAGWAGVRYWRRAGITTLSGAFNVLSARAARDPLSTALPAGFRPPATVQDGAGVVIMGTDGIPRTTAARAINYVASFTITYAATPA